MQSEFIAKVCLILQKSIDNGNINIEEEYVDLIGRIEAFVEKLIEFAKAISIYPFNFRKPCQRQTSYGI